MQENDAVAFYDRIVKGQDRTNVISLEHSSGDTLEGVRVSPVSKRVLASVIQRLPEEMFEAVDEADNPDDAEEELENRGLSTKAVTEQTVEAFEDLCKQSLTHDELTNTQMNQIIDNLGFEVLFSLGAEIIEISFDNSGEIKDFHEPE